MVAALAIAAFAAVAVLIATSAVIISQKKEAVAAAQAFQKYKSEAEEKTSAAQAEAARANEAAARVNERAAGLEAEAARLNKVAEDERLARIEIEEALAPRRLDIHQQLKMAGALGRFSGQMVTFWYQSGDAEAAVFAEEIAASLYKAKWKTFAPASSMTFARSGMLFDPKPHQALETGIEIASTEDDSSRFAANAVANELNTLGFNTNTPIKIQKAPAPTVWVNVNVRPIGPQGPAKLKRLQKNGQ